MIRKERPSERAMRLAKEEMRNEREGRCTAPWHNGDVQSRNLHPASCPLCGEHARLRHIRGQCSMTLLAAHEAHGPATLRSGGQNIGYGEWPEDALRDALYSMRAACIERYGLELGHETFADECATVLANGKDSLALTSARTLRDHEHE